MLYSKYIHMQIHTYILNINMHICYTKLCIQKHSIYCKKIYKTVNYKICVPNILVI